MQGLSIYLTAKASRATYQTPILLDCTGLTYDVSFGTAVPGGFSRCSFSIGLPRRQAEQWYEGYLFNGIIIYEGTEIVWEGRISSLKIKDYGADVECEGYWASLTDQTLVSFWADNDHSHWQTPVGGAGDVAQDISLAGAGAIGWFNIENSAGLMRFTPKTGITYNSGEAGVVYYKLPRVSNLLDRRIFQPMTLQSIQFEWFQVSLSLNLHHRVWTADKPLGTWTQRVDLSGSDVAGLKLYNLVPSGDANEGKTEIVAMGLQQVGGSLSGADESQYSAVKNVTIYAYRDPLGSGRATPKKIITSLLRGDSPNVPNTHAQQVDTDINFIDQTDLEAIPSIFVDETFQDILAKLGQFGVGRIQNWIPNPSVEESSYGWASHTDSEAGVTRIVGTSPEGLAYARAPSGGTGTGMFIYAGFFPVVRAPGEPPDSAPSSTPARIPVKPSTEYTFIGTARQLSGSNKTVDFNLRWYKADGTVSTVSTQGVTLTGSFVTSNIVATSPADAVSVRIEVISNAAQAAFDIDLDRVRFSEGSNTAEIYVDGDSQGYFWGGRPDDAVTCQVHPAIIGVYGHRRLHFRKRLDNTYKWVVPLKSLGAAGLELERTSQDLWGRVWAGFTEAFTGNELYSESISYPLSLAIYNAERDLVLPLGQMTESFAQQAMRIFSDIKSRPQQKAEVTCRGKIANAYGGVEPVHRVRAGDLVFIPDLSPLSSVHDRAKNIPQTYLDALKIFVVRETNYEMGEDELRFVPDNFPDSLELFLSRGLTLASISAVPSNFPSSASGAGSFSF